MTYDYDCVVLKPTVTATAISFLVNFSDIILMCSTLEKMQEAIKNSRHGKINNDFMSLLLQLSTFEMLEPKWTVQINEL